MQAVLDSDEARPGIKDDIEFPARFFKFIFKKSQTPKKHNSSMGRELTMHRLCKPSRRMGHQALHGH